MLQSTSVPAIRPSAHDIVFKMLPKDLKEQVKTQSLIDMKS
jgi:hypothetical protein